MEIVEAFSHLSFVLVVDYILFARIDEKIIGAIKLNQNEVAEHRFLSLHQLSELPILTPWLRMIHESGNLSQWFNSFSSKSPPTPPTPPHEIQILK
jgi:isopentenyldiphosphate isomerase